MWLVGYGRNSDHKVTSQHRGNREIHFKCDFSNIRPTLQKFGLEGGLGSGFLRLDNLVFFYKHIFGLHTV